jgi:hypothetical protein
MGDNSLLPISDEQAILGQELVKALRDGSGYLTDILGDLPRDLIGYLIGDRVKAKRIERMAVLWQRTRERLRDRGTDPEPPSLKYAIPILEAAADRRTRSYKTSGRVCWPPRWTRTDETRCARPSSPQSSKWTR